MRGWFVGILILAVTAISPNLAASGIMAVLAAYGFARFIRMDAAFLDSGFYTYNPLLVGLSIGYLFKLTTLTLFFVAAAGIGAFLLTHMLFNIFSYYLRLPVLSLPFVIVSTAAYLAASRYSSLYTTSLYPHAIAHWELMIPLWLGGFLKSLGAVFFLPTVSAGLVFAVILLVASRILFGLAVAGYYTGTLLLSWLQGSAMAAFSDVNAFNFILIAMSIGGVFLIPSLRTYVLSIVAVAVSTLLLSSAEAVAANFGLPVFALPFNFVALTFLYVLALVEYPHIARTVKATPEDTLDDYLTNQLRYPGSNRSLRMPFSGRWTVWQAFDGRWTHQGSWRYAYDFVITDEEGKTFEKEGRRLEEYYCFRKPVLSPARGRVVSRVDDLPDNPIGETDRTNNWGNYVIIRDERGFFVEVSHLAENSVRVETGEWVEPGSLLGLCGNSGYSPQPHVHVQVQAAETIGSATIPFSFIQYLVDDGFHANDTPDEGQVVEPVYANKAVEQRMAYVLDESFRYRVEDAGKQRELHLVVRMAPDGSFYLDSGSGRLYFGSHEGTFYHYHVNGNDPYLKYFLIALPRLPLGVRPGMSWQDSIPVGLVSGWAGRVFLRWLRSFFHPLAHVTVALRAVEEGSIVSTITGGGALRYFREARVELDDYRGINSLSIGPLKIRRVQNAT